MACERISKSEWDWKSGESRKVRLGSLEIPMNYFSCGVYFFDGIFQVVKFPKGMQLYHGSGALANANVEFPVGVDFYSTESPTVDNRKLMKDLENSNESVEHELTKYLPVAAGWFASPRVAKTYSLQNKTFTDRCGDKCVSSYELTKDTTFIILHDNFNIWKIISDMSVPRTVKEQLLYMYSLSPSDVLKARLDNQNFGEITIPGKKRRSYREIDLPFMKWLCGYLPKEYAGYAANVSVQNAQPYFHLEFAFCNPMKWLKRTLENKIDWQHNNILESASDIIRLFMEQLSYYKSANVNFHAGNLLEHSIWSLLFAEQLMTNLTATPIGTPNLETQRQIAAAAFLHDIGKMYPTGQHKRSHDFIYYDIKDHPKIGGDYIRGTKSLPLVDENMNQIGVFDVPALLAAFGFGKQDIPSLASIVDLHWEFGHYLQKWKGVGDMGTIKEFINHIGIHRPFIFFYSLIIVSIADVLASQPFGKNNLTAELNHHSKFFPFIANVPKKYRGGNIADKTAARRNLFAELILKQVTKMDMEMEIE